MSPTRSIIRRSLKELTFAAVGMALAVVTSPALMAQATAASGSISGSVTDPSGALLSEANVVITNIQTGQQISLTTNTAGAYTASALQPGKYTVQISSKGFRTIRLPLTVQLGNTANGNAKLEVGATNEVVEVKGAEVQIDTEQAEVQGVLTSVQIDSLPVNGRNFLDLAQLEPGVQIQDGQNFDPTKAGYSSISFGGRFGRAARITVDGVDISDETVGTTTADIPASAISEFQLSQSSLDLSNDLTSSGAVNVTTRSGTNNLHGEAFYLFRNHDLNAAAPGGVNQYFQRQQFGGRFGGPIIKSKLFFFVDGERTRQDAQAGVLLAGTPYDSFTGSFSQPFRENNVLARADYVFANGAKAFFRYSYFSNSLFATFGLGYSVYDNKDYTRQNVGGIDFSIGNSSTHSVRYAYLKFQNEIVDATLNNPTLPLCCTGLTLSSGAAVSSGAFYVGPNPLAPQTTAQSNNQVRYDGTKVLGAHTLRFGFLYNYIQGATFAAVLGIAPRVGWPTNPSTIAFADSGPFPGGSSNPLNYPVNLLRIGNGQGFSTTEASLGFPAGGLGPDNRIGVYFGDVWKMKPNFTLTAGVRYVRDTGRTDSDLPAIPEINAVFPGWGDPVKQPNLNFAPQLGFAWDPKSNGKTVIRGGVGLFYENAIWNNMLFDSPQRLSAGAFLALTSACLGGEPQPVPVKTGTILPSGICGNDVHVGNVIPKILSFWQQVLAGNPFDIHSPNPSFAGTSLAEGRGIPGPSLFAPNYKTPRSVQMNIGVQHELHRGLVISADYLRNIETHTLLGIDINHVGDVSNFSLSGAQAAISNTNAAFGCNTVDCAIGKGATMADYAGFGLASDVDIGFGCAQPVSAGGVGHPCAFGGKVPTQTVTMFLQPIGRTVYNALQVKLTQNAQSPMRWIQSLNFQASYSLSNFSSVGGAQVTGTAADSDQDFVLRAADYNQPSRYYGPSVLDRTHQISFGGFAGLPFGLQIGFIAHFYSPLSSAIVAPNLGNPGEIFRTDFTGDGTIGDPIPGTHFGEFNREVSASNLNSLISAYNQTYGNNPTPAGQVLIQNGLMTLSQLQALGGVAPHICLAPPAIDDNPSCSPNSPGGQVGFSWLRAFDLKLGWQYRVKENFTIEPNVAFYNLFNFSNFNLPPNTMTGILFGAGNGSINGTTRIDNQAFRVGNGTGVYSLGSYRQIEFGMRLIF
jgi:hypothetical protein